MKPLKTVWVVIILLLLLLQLAPAQAATERLQPENLQYLGAFRLPEGDTDTGWSYGGFALAYHPGGDPAGSGDGYPGSLFGTGNDIPILVSEIGIPAPVVSAGKNLGELNTATQLQPFTNIIAPFFDYLEQPRVGLCYLGPQAGQGSGKVHFCVGQHLQDTGFEASHGWFETNLADPQTSGLWVFGGYSGYVTNDYVCQIPSSWAEANAPGRLLAAGRAREGPWAGGGPGLFAYAPWVDGDPPAAGTNLSTVIPLLLYGTQAPGVPEIQFDSSQTLNNNQDPDRWRSVAWLTSGNHAAVVFAGTKALGRCWYGFANGVEWPYDCAEQGNCPQVPDYPYNNRGFWADDFQAQLMFYDPEDLGRVARGEISSWEPQPYAIMDLSPFFFEPDYNDDDLIRYKRDFVGSITFDRDRGLLYVMETLVEEDGRGLVHVFRAQP